MDIIEKSILRDLLLHKYVMKKSKLIQRFPSHLRLKVPVAIQNLKNLQYLVEDSTEEGLLISIPSFMVTDATKQVSTFFKDYSSAIEELIPSRYSSHFLITKGEHDSRYGISEYVFCSKKKDMNDISCLIVKDGKYTPLHLGSIYDQNSKVSRFLHEVTTKMGINEFTKEDLQYILPKDIIGNRQPLKALTDYLCHIGFLKRIEYPNSTKFQLTDKTRIVTTLDKVIDSPKTTQSTLPVHKNSQYAYSEEDGLYPIFY